MMAEAPAETDPASELNDEIRLPSRCFHIAAKVVIFIVTTIAQDFLYP